MLKVARIPTKKEKEVEKVNYVSISKTGWLSNTLYARFISVYSWNKDVRCHQYLCFTDKQRFRKLNKPPAKGQKPGSEPKCPKLLPHNYRPLLYKIRFWVPDQGEKEIITPLSFETVLKDELWNFTIYYEIKQRMERTFKVQVQLE